MRYKKHSIYARVNKNQIVTKIFSDVFEHPTDRDILVEKGNEEYHTHIHLKYTLADSNGIYNYKIVNNKLILRSDEEKQQEMNSRPPIPPTEQEKIQILERENEKLKTELTNTQLAITEIYESMGV